jgi:uncharacterized membrane protein
MRFLALLKFILILLLFVAGICFLLKGLGVTIPLIEYEGAKAHDVPAGIVLVILGIVLARFWKITSTTVTKTTKRSKKDGEDSNEEITTTTQTTVETLYEAPIPDDFKKEL